MLNSDFFDYPDSLYKRYKTHNPEELCDALHYKFIPLKNTILGYAKYDPGVDRSKFEPFVIGVKVNSSTPWLYDYVFAHELYHIFKNHVGKDTAFFTRDKSLLPFNSKIISRAELSANVGAADMILPTDDILYSIGYNTDTMCEYRHLKRKCDKLFQELAQLRLDTCYSMTYKGRIRIQKLEQSYNESYADLYERARDIEFIDCCHSLQEIAYTLDTDIFVVKYKMEALRIRGYDIDIIELPDYSDINRFA